MPAFAVTYTYADRPAEVAAVRPSHREFLSALFAAGDLVASGPMDDGAAGLLVVVADDAAAARALLAADPIQQAGLVDSVDVRSWAPVIGRLADLT